MSRENQVGPVTILVVDEEPDVRMLISEALNRSGYTVVECPDGRSAPTLLARGDIDLAVLDLGPLGRPGLDVLTELRRSSPVPVIVVSGRGEESDRTLGFELGAADYLPKPFSPSELVVRVESVLRRSREP